MFHAVPTELARNKTLAETFRDHWNRLVSPGNLIYTQRDEGREFLQGAQAEGLLVSENVETKEFFR